MSPRQGQHIACSAVLVGIFVTSIILIFHVKKLIRWNVTLRLPVSVSRSSISCPPLEGERSITVLIPYLPMRVIRHLYGVCALYRSSVSSSKHREDLYSRPDANDVVLALEWSPQRPRLCSLMDGPTSRRLGTRSLVLSTQRMSLENRCSCSPADVAVLDVLVYDG